MAQLIIVSVEESSPAQERLDELTKELHMRRARQIEPG
jgi:hypothetical protein